MAEKKRKRKEPELITVNTNTVLQLTGWDIHKLLDVLGVPEEKQADLIAKIDRSVK